MIQLFNLFSSKKLILKKKKKMLLGTQIKISCGLCGLGLLCYLVAYFMVNDDGQREPFFNYLTQALCWVVLISMVWFAYIGKYLNENKQYFVGLLIGYANMLLSSFLFGTAALMIAHPNYFKRNISINECNIDASCLSFCFLVMAGAGLNVVFSFVAGDLVDKMKQ